MSFTCQKKVGYDGQFAMNTIGNAPIPSSTTTCLWHWKASLTYQCDLIGRTTALLVTRCHLRTASVDSVWYILVVRRFVQPENLFFLNTLSTQGLHLCDRRLGKYGAQSCLERPFSFNISKLLALIVELSWFDQDYVWRMAMSMPPVIPWMGFVFVALKCVSLSQTGDYCLFWSSLGVLSPILALLYRFVEAWGSCRAFIILLYILFALISIIVVLNRLISASSILKMTSSCTAEILPWSYNSW